MSQLNLSANILEKTRNFLKKRILFSKNLINIWSSRGLSIYKKLTTVKLFLIPKFPFACLVLPTPRELIKELNNLLFKFFSKDTDKVKRVSVINEYEEGGLRTVDLECMEKSVKLAWLRRIFNEINAAHLLCPLGGFYLLACNYNIYIRLYNSFSILL